MGFVTDLSRQRIYLDSNIFLYALNETAPYATVAGEVFDAMDGGKLTGVTSELTLAEILVTPFRNGNSDQEQLCRAILQRGLGFEMLPISRSVLETVARLRAAMPALRTPDGIHAATAQLSNCDALLTNDRRLKGLPGIRVLLLSEAATP
jgi:predicted nucleic acid-binding protein